ncbi:sensor histidine kinase KdpD [Rossellomorea aquimaris]|uniref:histidine kinase n=1 Tax=Rossellomorea aquimaris TaxID=189382 RepID=A0A5D4U420_9BACI|nr:HAMP domain-containing sensor histidine kinase [Rossellomorea aquimaris]TYS82018.1 HAMP domain-containing histidine kinase [Rossellomorea aquimaris]TYS88642.1 HAMP domain-containing histidine kinase [Rossellomorea aquimaris]
MNIHKQFMFHFFGQLILTVLFLGSLVLALFAIIGFWVMEEEVKEDLSEAGSLYFSSNIKVDRGKVHFKEELRTLVREQNGWLIVYTDEGVPIGSYLTPKRTEKELLEEGTGTDYRYWNLDLPDSQTYVLIYGEKHPNRNLIQYVKEDMEWSQGRLSLSESTNQRMKKENAWVQLLDSNGKVVDDYGTENEPEYYSVRELLNLKSKENVSTFIDEKSKQKILVGIRSYQTSPSQERNIFKAFTSGGFILLLVLFTLLVLATLWHARKFGLPLLTMMKWIKNLSDGVYVQPLDDQEHPIMLKKNGRLKRKYRLYKDLITNLSHLTETLHHNKRHEKQMIMTREEWISGLSHDLKTPLSSISGYAHMLGSAAYTWSKEETMEFADIISEKSEFMRELLDDLTLTYRLKNQALPISKERTELNEIVRRTVIQYINDQANRDKELLFEPYDESLYAEVDLKWFQRILDNVLANAIHYNPAGTKITVSLQSIEHHLIVITILDNGKGMDTETLDKLFQRYYRGTSTTKTTSGSGLGMAITKQLIELHGGSINVTSAPGKGTKVRIIVPV